MTSEAHRLETPPPAVSVKARALEIEARSLASGKGPSTPVARKEEVQVNSSPYLSDSFPGLQISTAGDDFQTDGIVCRR